MEAFVYCWTDKKTNMLYVGSHKGSTDDGYICSSKYMMEEYNKRPKDFSRQIIAEGDLSDMRKFETKILQAVNARLDEQFYNMHNNNGCYILKRHTESTKRKISESEKGKVVSQKSRLKMKNSKIGFKNNRWGTPHNEETKRKMSLSAQGRKFKEEHKYKLSQAKLGKSWFHNPNNNSSGLYFPGTEPEGWIKGRK
jgi:hypothetical protein